jgi:hypothetical protein
MNLIKTPLTQGETVNLTRWLSDPAFNIFIRVVESRAFASECEAVKALVKGGESVTGVASGHIQNAEKERYVLKVMREMATQKEFTTVKATPN